MPEKRPHFLHVALDHQGEIDWEQFEEVLNKAVDWIHYMQRCWIVRTKLGAGTWYKRLKPLIKEGDHLFVARMDLSDRQGWLPDWVWKWMHKYDPKRAMVALGRKKPS